MISMIVPLYRGRKYLDNIIMMFETNRCNLNNAIKGHDLELILVNDYPQEKIKASGTGIRLINNPCNQGIHASRIRGLLASKGEYLFFLDQDDTINAHYVEKQLMIALREDADATVCNGYHHDMPIYVTKKYGIECVTQRMGECKIISPGQVLIRKDAVPPEWRERIIRNSGVDDYFLWIMLHGRNAKFSYNDEILYEHVITRENQSKNLEGMIASHEELRQILSGLSLDDEYLEYAISRNDRLIYAYTLRKNVDAFLDNISNNRVIMENILHTYHCSDIIIYGFGTVGQQCFQVLQKACLPVASILDEKEGKKIAGMPDIKKPTENEIKNISNKELVIVTPIKDMNEIKEHLISGGVKNVITIGELVREANIM